MSNYVAQSKARLIDLLMFFPFFQKKIGEQWFSRWNNHYVLAEQELSILPRLLKKDSIIFDVGANRGELSYFFAVHCGAQKVFSFEPQQRMFGILHGIAKHVKNIHPVNVAFSDSLKERTLQIPVQGTGRYTPAASFEELPGQKLAGEVVHVETLDNFVAKNSITKLDFIKCDTEGHELSVLKGSQKTLTALRPLLYIEVKESTKNSLFDLLKKAGYRPYQWDRGLARLALVTDAYHARSENYYFVPQEKEAEILSALS